MTTARREFLKKGSALVAGAGLAGIGLSRAGCALTGEDVSSHKAAATEYPLDSVKMESLAKDSVLKEDFIAALDETVDAMMEDADLRIRFMENCDSALLLRLYRENAKELEPICGRLDARTSRGRLKILLLSSEMFQNVSGVDYVNWGDSVDVEGANPELWGCSTCLSGCCITHFWGWSGGSGACC